MEGEGSSSRTPIADLEDIQQLSQEKLVNIDEVLVGENTWIIIHCKTLNKHTVLAISFLHRLHLAKSLNGFLFSKTYINNHK